MKKNYKNIILTIVSFAIFLPATFLLFFASVMETETITSSVFMWTIIKIFLFLGLIIVVSQKRIRNTLADAIKNPILVTAGFLMVGILIAYNDYSVFSPREAEFFKSTSYIYLIGWLLFSLIQSNSFIEKVPKWLLWIIRTPIWLIIFFTTIIFLEITGMSIFSNFFF